MGRTVGIAALLVTALLGTAGCGGDEVRGEAPLPPDDPCAPSLVAETPLSAEVSARLDAALAEGFELARAPGLVAHVVVPGEGEWYGAAGLADFDAEIPMTTGASFRVGSITKTFTAAAVLQLADEGRWSLDDPLDDYVSGWGFGPEVTLARLLNHTTGIYNYTDDAGFLSRVQERVEPAVVIDFALSHGEVFPPGTDYLYSNTGYFLLGLALESVEGKPFAQILRERLLDPHGLTSLHMEQYEAQSCGPTPGYVGFGTDIGEDFSMSWAWAAGGLTGDVRDLCRWGLALFEPGNVLPEATLEAMQVPSEHGPYGLGVRLTSKGDRSVVGHTGSTMGFNTELFVDPTTRTCVAIQSNDFFGVTEPVAYGLWSVLNDAGL